MFNFCIKADNCLAESFEDQICVCNHFLINNIEIPDRIDGEALSSLSGKKIEQCRRVLINSNKKIVLLDCAAPLGDLDEYRMLFRKAHLLGVENIRVEPDAQTDGDKLSPKLAEIMKIGRCYGIGVMIENNRGTRFDADQPIADLLERAGDMKPGIIFNPLEFAAKRSHPFFHVFYNCRWKSRIAFLRVNDGLFVDGSPTMPAEGNAEIKEMASALLARGFIGYFSFHPYLQDMDEELYYKVINRFKNLLLAM